MNSNRPNGILRRNRSRSHLDSAWDQSKKREVEEGNWWGLEWVRKNSEWTWNTDREEEGDWDFFEAVQKIEGGTC